jgi:hypothetical protein
LENFFSCVRGYALANSKPTRTSFAHTTKALLVNNLVSPCAIGANCEDDGSLSYLDNLKTFLTLKLPSQGLLWCWLQFTPLKRMSNFPLKIRWV